MNYKLSCAGKDFKCILPSCYACPGIVNEPVPSAIFQEIFTFSNYHYFIILINRSQYFTRRSKEE